MTRTFWSGIVWIVLAAPVSAVAQEPCSIECSCCRPGPWQALQLRIRSWLGRNRCDDGACLKVPPVPHRVCPEPVEGGLLLKTGAFQLGPGVSRDLLRSQSDGYWGFWD